MIIEAGFLEETELIELIMLIRKFAQPAPQLNWPKGHCGSANVSLSAIESPIVKPIERRIQSRLGLSADCAEDLRGVWYRPREGYRIHHDAFYRDNQQWDTRATENRNRAWTALIYLNTLNSGGETLFPRMGLAIEPRAGMLIAWSNLLPDRSPDPLMVHSAESHEGTDKYIATVWFRESAT